MLVAAPASLPSDGVARQPRCAVCEPAVLHQQRRALGGARRGFGNGHDAGKVVEHGALCRPDVASLDARSCGGGEGDAPGDRLVGAARVDVGHPDRRGQSPDQRHPGRPVENGAAIRAPRRADQHDPQQREHQRRDHRAEVEGRAVAGLAVAQQHRDAQRHAVQVGVDPGGPQHDRRETECQDAEPVERRRLAPLERVHLARGQDRERRGKGHGLDDPRVGHQCQRHEEHDCVDSGYDDARLGKTAIEAAPADPEHPRTSGSAGHASHNTFFASQPGSMAALPGRNGTQVDRRSAANQRVEERGRSLVQRPWPGGGERQRDDDPDAKRHGVGAMAPGRARTRAGSARAPGSRQGPSIPPTGRRRRRRCRVSRHPPPDGAGRARHPGAPAPPRRSGRSPPKDGGSARTARPCRRR